MKMKKKMKKIAKSAVSLFKSKQIVPIIKTTNEVLKDKVALITGGSGGIGMAIAKSFIESGSKVIIAGTNQKKCEKCCNELGTKAKYIVINMLDVKSFKSKIEEASELWGVTLIYMLIRLEFIQTDII